MASNGVVMNHQCGSHSVSRGVKRPAEEPGSDKRSPKRRKTVDVKESSSSDSTGLHPQEVLSHDDSSHAASAVIKPVASSIVYVTSLRDTVTSNGATTTVEPVASIAGKNVTFLGAASNVLPTLPTVHIQSGTNESKAVHHEKKGSISKEGNQTSQRTNGTTGTSIAQSDVRCHDFKLENSPGGLTFANSCKLLCGMGALALLLFDVYRSSSYSPYLSLDKKAFSFSNLSWTEMKEVKLGSTLQCAPRRPLSLALPSQNLLAIDNYENLKSTLGTVKKELARAMKDLEKSRINAEEAREEATRAQNDYERLVSELEQTKNKLINNQHELNLALQKLNHTQEELKHTRNSVTGSKADIQRWKHSVSQELSHTQEKLEQTRKSWTISEMELKATLKELDAAHVAIDDLRNLLQVQESVAANALNFVATTAVNWHVDEMHRSLQVHEMVAAQALNFVVTVAVDSQCTEIAKSSEKGHDAANV